MTKFETQVDNIRARARRAGFELKYWKRGHDHRLYPEVGLDDVTVFLELQEYEDELKGFVLKIYSERARNRWYAGEKMQIRKQFKPIADCALVELHSEDMAADIHPSSREEVKRAVERYGL